MKDKAPSNDNVIPTYPQTLESKNIKKKNLPNILLNFNNTDNIQSIFRVIQQTLIKDTNVPMNYIKNTKDGKVIIKCHHDNDINKVRNLLDSAAEEKCAVSLQKLLNPLIKNL